MSHALNRLRYMLKDELFVRTPAAQHDKVAIGKALAASFNAYGILDRRLATTPFLAGDTLTYADIVAGVSMYRWMTMEIQRPELPHLAAWYERLTARPAFQKAVCVSYADMVGRLTF